MAVKVLQSAAHMFHMRDKPEICLSTGGNKKDPRWLAREGRHLPMRLFQTNGA